MMSKLSKQDVDALHEALYYLKMNELRSVCVWYALPEQGPKATLIERIHTFACYGNLAEQPTMPEVSKAQKRVAYDLLPDAYMFYGSYKNDARTRAFFKQLIGEHFHFTAYGIDWINERWYAGKPPTYREFATFWETEYAVRQRQKAQPKKEWAYINFVQHFLQEFPDASRDQCMQAWKIAREHNKKYVMTLLQIGSIYFL